MTSKVERILENIPTVPPLPATTVKLSQVLADPDSSIKDIAEVIQYDQSITANLLRLCNSAFFGFAEKVSSVKEAIVRLGTTKVFQLVMATSSRGLLTKKVAGYALGPGALWRHSVGTAISAQAICQTLKKPNMGVVFTAGLLHDVGKLVLSEYVAEDYQKLLEMSEQNDLTFVQAEEDLFGINHAELGARLAESWGLPPMLVECIRFHHRAEEAPEENEAVEIVSLADVIAMTLGLGLGSDGLRYRAKSNVCEHLGLERNQFDMLCADILLEFADVEKLFSGEIAK